MKSNTVSAWGEGVEEEVFKGQLGICLPWKTNYASDFEKSLHRHPAHWSQLCIHYMLKDSISVLLWIISEHLQVSVTWICFAQRHAQWLKRKSATVEAYDTRNGSKKSVNEEKVHFILEELRDTGDIFNRTTQILELIAIRCCGCKIKIQRRIGHTSQRLNP